jgi:hypothetical protein
LNYILRVLIMLNDPTRKIIGSVQVRQKDLFELGPFVSHYCNEPSDPEIYSRIDWPDHVTGEEFRLLAGKNHAFQG